MQEISDLAKLNALPVGSIVLDCDGDAWMLYDYGWGCTSNSTYYQSPAFYLPVYGVYFPEPEAA